MADSYSNNLIYNSIFHLLNFAKYPSFPVAAREAAINNKFQVVLFSEDFNTLFSVETRHVVRIEDVVHRGIEENGIRPDGQSVKVSYQGVNTYWRPVVVAGGKYYLMLVDNDDNYTHEEIAQLASIIELAMGMWNYAPERNNVAEFIRAVRRGNRGLAFTMLEELDLKESELSVAFYVPGIEKDAAIKTLNEFEKRFSLRTLKFADGGELAGVVLRDPKSKLVEEQDWKDFAKTLSGFGADKTFHVTGLESIEDLCGAFQMINETEAFVQLIFPYKHSFSKFELALASNCVNICMESGSSKKNYQDLIKPLVNARDGKSKQLMETLETYMLDAGFSTAKTSKLMNIHANTVQYRLKRIRELLGVDIIGNRIVPGLVMALALSRIEKEVKSL